MRMTMLLCNGHIKSTILHNKQFAKGLAWLNALNFVNDAEAHLSHTWLWSYALRLCVMKQCCCQPLFFTVCAGTLFCVVFYDCLLCCGTSVRLMFCCKFTAELQDCNVHSDNATQTIVRVVCALGWNVMSSFSLVYTLAISTFSSYLSLQVLKSTHSV